MTVSPAADYLLTDFGRAWLKNHRPEVHALLPPEGHVLVGRLVNGSIGRIALLFPGLDANVHGFERMLETPDPAVVLDCPSELIEAFAFDAKMPHVPDLVELASRFAAWEINNRKETEMPAEWKDVLRKSLSPPNDWGLGAVCVVKADCVLAGEKVLVLGEPVFIGQWWVPVLHDDSRDPDMMKLSALEKVE